MSINEQIFSDLVITHLESIDYKKVKEDDVLQFIFESESKETDVLVYCDPDEYTVCIGEFFHAHFDIYSCSSEIKEEQFKEAGEHAIGFIKAFMRNDIWLKVDLIDGESIGSSITDGKETFYPIIPVGEKKNNSTVIKKIFKWKSK